jgi:aminoglycoside 3-N-acetyltransferase I
MIPIQCMRLAPTDGDLARQLFELLNEVFEGEGSSLSDAYIDRLLLQETFWVVAAFVEGKLVGGLTAHALPMTTAQAAEVFIFDLAVLPSHQRQGVGRQLLATLRDDAARAGISDVFVPADNEDAHALDFYRALGGQGTPATIFTFKPMSLHDGE